MLRTTLTLSVKLILTQVINLETFIPHVSVAEIMRIVTIIILIISTCALSRSITETNSLWTDCCKYIINDFK